ncbi:MerR family transcriptional regulator [Vibrio sp. SCSIO 43140]|uniref:MerR family transcriptional regulator n=1 Tax=Vibrio sp. SCSIO 43140 TaxID=2819100 RepID=UPI00207613C2|nr:MerR family transcriptional regulator [Vibrio sp. SCSIO 43140]USD62666.1 MerR family transcriptional regulator [Vibrio sp. SCSIO 43140]
MLTVTQLARECQVSRTTILYYEREGLLMPASRSDNGYRWYGTKEINRLKQIISYRSYGLPIQEITELLSKQNHQKSQQILRNQFEALENEVQSLRLQQKAILAALGEPITLTSGTMNKEQWVEIMRSAGFDEKDMQQWHCQFERMRPEAHHEFLESLSIDADEIESIRAQSRQG